MWTSKMHSNPALRASLAQAGFHAELAVLLVRKGRADAPQTGR